MFIDDEAAIEVRAKEWLQRRLEMFPGDDRLPRSDDVGGTFATVDGLVRTSLLGLSEGRAEGVHITAHPAVSPSNLAVGQARVELGKRAGERVGPGRTRCLVTARPRIDAP